MGVRVRFIINVNGRNYTPFGISNGEAVIKALKPKLCIVFVSSSTFIISKLKHKKNEIRRIYRKV